MTWRRWVRQTVAALVVALAPALLPSAAAADVSDDVAAGLGDFGACLEGAGEGDMVVLLDQSGSLETTDPDNGRRVAAMNLMDGLVRYAEAKGASLDVLVAGFAADFEEIGEWTAVGPSTHAQLREAVDLATRELVPLDTDYVNALEGARQALADHRAGASSPRGCQSVVWFSDGRHVIDVRDGADEEKEFGTEKPYAPGADLTTEGGADEARSKGEEELCRPAGVGDQLRSAGITMIGIGLSSESAGGASADDFDLMRDVTVGDGCGDVTEPAGVFHPASSIEELIGALDALAQGGPALPSSGPQAICHGGVCPEGTSEFTLDDSISSVHIFGLTDVAGTHAVLVRPDGQELVLAAEGQAVDGPATVNWLTPKSFTIDLAKARFTDSWSGQWRIAIIDPASTAQDGETQLTIHLSSSIETRWPSELSQLARAGEILEGVQLELVDSDSEESIDPSAILGSIEVDATIVDAGGTRFGFLDDAGAESIADPVSVDLRDAVPGPATVEISTTITTASASREDGTLAPGSRLDPRESSTSFELAPAAGFPALPEIVDFGILDGELTGDGEIVVTGPGCVWLDLDATSVVGAPSLAGLAAVDAEAVSEATCISVPEGKTGTVPVSLTVEDFANGAVSGELSVVTAPLDELTRTQPVPVEFRADLRKPLDAETAWLVAMLAALAGLIPPLAILYGFKWLTARIPKGTYRIAVVNGVIDRNGRTELELPNESDIAMVRGGERSITTGPYRLVAHMSASPFGRTRVLLEGADAASVSSAIPSHVGTRAVLPQDINNRWVAVADHGGDSDTVTVILMLGRSRQQWEGLVAEARADVAGAVREVVNETDRAAPGRGSQAGKTGGPGRGESQVPGTSGAWDGTPSRGHGPAANTPWSTGQDSPKNAGW